MFGAFHVWCTIQEQYFYSTTYFTSTGSTWYILEANKIQQTNVISNYMILLSSSRCNVKLIVVVCPKLRLKPIHSLLIHLEGFGENII
jgi:hypothetical protein